MKHIKTFENYSYKETEKVNEEFIGSILRTILSIPKGILGVLVLQFINGRTVSKAIESNILDVYSNIDVLIDTLQSLSDNEDITDVEKRKVNIRLKELQKVKRKYPTLDDYKKKLKSMTPFMNMKNRKYLKSKIESYTPREMSVYEVLDMLNKFYKGISRSDVVGVEDPVRNRFRDRLDSISRRDEYIEDENDMGGTEL